MRPDFTSPLKSHILKRSERVVIKWFLKDLQESGSSTDQSIIQQRVTTIHFESVFVAESFIIYAQ